jgi:hypothetical protein
MFSKRYKNINIQSHYLLAERIQSMIRYLDHIRKPTDEQKQAIFDLEVEASQHRRTAYLTGDEFITIR